MPRANYKTVRERLRSYQGIHASNIWGANNFKHKHATPSRISDKLTFYEQSLQMVGTFEHGNGYVSKTLDTLHAIRGDLVRMDPFWENCTLKKIVRTSEPLYKKKVNCQVKQIKIIKMTGRQINNHPSSSKHSKTMCHAPTMGLLRRHRAQILHLAYCHQCRWKEIQNLWLAVDTVSSGRRIPAYEATMKECCEYN